MKNTKNFYINGQWIEPSENNVLDVINPANEEVVSEISLGNENDLNKAVSAAKKVFPTYSITTKEERLEIFEKIMDVYKKRLSDLAKAITSEMGAPVNLANAAQAPAGLGHLKKAYNTLKEYEFALSNDLVLI